MKTSTEILLPMPPLPAGFHRCWSGTGQVCATPYTSELVGDVLRSITCLAAVVLVGGGVWYMVVRRREGRWSSTLILVALTMLGITAGLGSVLVLGGHPSVLTWLTTATVLTGVAGISIIPREMRKGRW